MSWRLAALAVILALLACARAAMAPRSQPIPPPPAGSQAAPPPSDPTGADATEPAPEGPEAPAAVAAGARESIPAAAPDSIPTLLRVGLASDLQRVRIPCCFDGLVAEGGGETLSASAGLEIFPAEGVGGSGGFRLQVAALRAETQAAALAARLGERFAAAAVSFDAGTGLYRVRLGRFETRSDAEAALSRFSLAGLTDSRVVSEPAALERPALEVVWGDGRRVLAGRWLEIREAVAAGRGIPVLGARYRGDLLVYLNDRGRLNLINRVSLDDYLRGVVPREMGPELYRDLQALKAQAVAARTYTLRNLGEFRDEGFDICATPRCQVYGGLDVEHALSDRAVLETTGEVLLDGADFADTLYSSTCGGHTENVEVVFPSKHHAYLRGVPCLERGVGRLAEPRRGSGSLEEGILADLLPGPEGRVEETWLQRFVAGSRRLTALAGRPVAARAPASSDRREVHRYLGELLALDSGRPLPASDPELARFLEPPPGWSAGDLRLAARLVRFGLMETRLTEPISETELTRALYRMAVYLRLVERIEGRYLSLEEGRLSLRRGAEVHHWEVTASTATFRRRQGRLGKSDLELLAGDPVEAYTRGERLLAVVQRIDPEPRFSPFSPARPRGSWRLFRSDRELARLVESRYPGLGFQGLEVLSRGVSGRVAALGLIGAAGQRVEVIGLPIRWTLDLPDTSFTVVRGESPAGEAGWIFTGRGHGHGVGMCQVGAYEMGRRGHRYADILDYYYTGLELRKLPPSEAGAAPPVAP